MHIGPILGFLACLSFASTPALAANLVTIKFSGRLDSASGIVPLSLPLGTTVSGEIVYDLDVPASDVDMGAVLYPAVVSHHVSIGTLSWSGGEHMVLVTDGPNDGFEIRTSSQGGQLVEGHFLSRTDLTLLAFSDSAIDDSALLDIVAARDAFPDQRMTFFFPHGSGFFGGILGAEVTIAPLPATLPMLAAALGAFGWLSARRSYKEGVSLGYRRLA
jgi:hypothetical protein